VFGTIKIRLNFARFAFFKNEGKICAFGARNVEGFGASFEVAREASSSLFGAKAARLAYGNSRCVGAISTRLHRFRKRTHGCPSPFLHSSNVDEIEIRGICILCLGNPNAADDVDPRTTDRALESLDRRLVENIPAKNARSHL
jgi:hypothetical protein